MDHINHDRHDKEEFDLVEERPKGIIFRIARGFIVFALIGGLLYISGVNRYFFYQRTPASVQQQTIESQIDAQSIVVPLTVYIIAAEGSKGSGRTVADVTQLVENADRIWDQANIDLAIDDIAILQKRDAELELLLRSPNLFIQGIEDFRFDTVNVFLVGNLDGINGVAFTGLQSVAVADYTTVHDFRALAHEVGHILGLDHIKDNQGRLMYQGANGDTLSLEEIMRARKTAEQFTVTQR